MHLLCLHVYMKFLRSKKRKKTKIKGFFIAILSAAHATYAARCLVLKWKCRIRWWLLAKCHWQLYGLCISHPSGIPMHCTAELNVQQTPLHHDAYTMCCGTLHSWHVLHIMASMLKLKCFEIHGIGLLRNKNTPALWAQTIKWSMDNNGT